MVNGLILHYRWRRDGKRNDGNRQEGKDVCTRGWGEDSAAKPIYGLERERDWPGYMGAPGCNGFERAVIV